MDDKALSEFPGDINTDVTPEQLDETIEESRRVIDNALRRSNESLNTGLFTRKPSNE